MRKPIHIVLIASLTVAAAAAGCGDSGSASSATPLTKAQFIKQGDAICAKADKEQINAYLDFAKDDPKRLETKSGEQEVVTVAGLPPVQTMIDELGELGVPKGDQAQVEALLKGMEKALEEAEAEPGKVLELSAGSPFGKPDRMAREYGFEDCGDTL